MLGSEEECKEEERSTFVGESPTHQPQFGRNIQPTVATHLQSPAARRDSLSNNSIIEQTPNSPSPILGDPSTTTTNASSSLESAAVERQMRSYRRRMRCVVMVLFSMTMLAIALAVISAAAIRLRTDGAAAEAEAAARIDRTKSLTARLEGYPGVNFTNWNEQEDAPQQQALDWLVKNPRVIEGLSDDRLLQKWVLLIMWFETRGLRWYAGGLVYSVDECLWSRNRCGSDGALLHLDMKYNFLQGTMPQELGLLTKLTALHLRGNRLSGTLPAQLGDLTRLQVLDLQQNLLEGLIPPSLARLTNLKLLYLDKTDLTGEIPDSICITSPYSVECDSVSCGCCGCPLVRAFD